MKILFTGSSSFTGYWFIRELVRAGHDVTALFRRRREEYAGVRAARVEQLAGLCRCTFGGSFGDEAFLRLINGASQWDVLCHHAAEVGDYKSESFDPLAALASNTRNLRAVLAALRERGARRIVLTGSVFEPGEGAGSDDLPAVSAYGLSKSLTATVFRHYVPAGGMRLGKFVIPNPFGPYEEPRFTTYLARCWLAGQTATVRTPDYVRDNIHVCLLARAYVGFVERLSEAPGFERLNPRGYVERQGQFARRMADALSPRLGLPCQLELLPQTEFPEPRVRHNTQPATALAPEWSESHAWDRLAQYYRQMPAS
jgi:UDP-glucose 4-epimerase